MPVLWLFAADGLEVQADINHETTPACFRNFEGRILNRWMKTLALETRFAIEEVKLVVRTS